MDLASGRRLVFTTPTDLADCWATGAASVGQSRDYWLEGCKYAQVHWELGLNGGYDFMGTGSRNFDLLLTAQATGKEVILACTLAEVDGGTIRPVSTFHDGINAEIADLGGPEAVADEMISEARRLGVSYLKVGNEWYDWDSTELVPLDTSERIQRRVMDAAPNLRVIIPWHPQMSPELARRAWRVEFHYFPRTGESTSQIVAGIEATANAIKAKGGHPSLLEWVTGRPERGPYTSAGAARYKAIVEAAAANGCDPLGIWWGGYKGSRKLWSAPGWGQWALWVTSEQGGLSQAFTDTFLEGDALPSYREAFGKAQRLAKRGLSNTDAALELMEDTRGAALRYVRRADARLAEIIALEASDSRPPPADPDGVRLLRAIENMKAASDRWGHVGVAARFEWRMNPGVRALAHMGMDRPTLFYSHQGMEAVDRGTGAWTVDHRTSDQSPHHGLAYFATQAGALEAYAAGRMPHD